MSNPKLLIFQSLFNPLIFDVIVVADAQLRIKTKLSSLRLTWPRIFISSFHKKHSQEHLFPLMSPWYGWIIFMFEFCIFEGLRGYVNPCIKLCLITLLNSKNDFVY